MKPVVILLLCFFVFVESGVILDNVQGGISKTGHRIRCGVRRFGGVVLQRPTLECKDENENEVVATKDDDDSVRNDNDNTSEKLFRITTEVGESSTRKEVRVFSTTEEPVTVPEGKRILGVKPNCPDGYKDDGKGKCRESFN